MKVIIALSLTFLASAFLNAQTNATKSRKGLDSLYAVWQDDSQTDSIRCTAYKQYIWDGFLYSKTDTAFALANALIDYSQEKQYPLAMGLAYHLKGVSIVIKNARDPQALDYFERALRIYKEIGNRKGTAAILSNIGTVFIKQGNRVQALFNYERALRIYQEIKDNAEVAAELINIGSIYLDQRDRVQALDYFENALKIFKEIKHKRGVARALNRIGVAYMNMDKRPQALDYFQRVISIYTEIGVNSGIAIALNNIGFAHLGQDSFPQALRFFQRSLAIHKQINNRTGIAHTSGNIGYAYKELGEYGKAIEFCKRGLHIGEEIGNLGKQRKACDCLYMAYKSKGMDHEALDYLEKLIVIEDSLNSIETSKKLQQMEFTKTMVEDSLRDEQKRLKIKMAHDLEVMEKNRQRNVSIGSGLFMLLLAFGFFNRWRYVKKSRDTISKEKDRSENLLLNILPAEIAEELKTRGEAQAKDFEMVSILFTDFKGFTQISEKMSAKELVAELNYSFKAFDRICEKHQIEKIKTLGDSYMAAGGLPIPSPESAKNVVLAAIEMAQFIIDRKKNRESTGQIPFEMRTGIHTGHVVAGIVGVKKFQYDIWGDTVNTASRMESHGKVGKVNISQVTYELLKNEPDFRFERRGEIEVKGKGKIKMYFVSTI